MGWIQVITIAGGAAGLASFLWAFFSDSFSRIMSYLSGQRRKDIEEKRIESEEEQTIYDNLSHEVSDLRDRVDSLRGELSEVKEKYYDAVLENKEIKLQNQQLREQNTLIKKSNRRLYEAVSAILVYLEHVLETVSQEELPEFPESELAVDAVSIRLIKDIVDPEKNAVLEDLFENDDQVPDS